MAKNSKRVSRREAFKVGSTAAVGLAGAAVAGSALSQNMTRRHEAAIHLSSDPATTPIWDSISDDHASLLTERARTLTEADAILIGYSMRNTHHELPQRLQSLSHEDLQSLHNAFEAHSVEMLGNSSLTPSAIPLAKADGSGSGNSSNASNGSNAVTACCCTVCCCCCAAAQSPSRSRAIQ